MLSELHIKNIAIIDEVTVDFGKGLNILSGETGAGKSIIIDSINFVLGERAYKDIIKRGREEAAVSAMMIVESGKTRSKIREMGVDIDQSGELLIFRSLNTSGKNTVRLNGKAVPLGMIREISSLLIDIHGQHQHQSLLNPKKHIELLDIFCGKELNEALEENSKRYTEYRQSMKKLKELSGLGKDRESLIDILTFQINELKDAKIKVGEEEKLKEKRDILFNAARIKELAGSIVYNLYRGEGSAVEKIGDAIGSLTSLCKIDESLEETLDELEDINDKLSAVTEVVSDYADSCEGSGAELSAVDKRLDKIREICRKYGGTEEACGEFLQEAEEKLAAITESEERAKALGEKIKRQKREIYKCCLKISGIRQKYADKIEKEIEKNLHELGMENAEFKINIVRKNSFDRSGMDNVEFFIKTNLGEEPKPLAKIASGGEMSRVMLSIKAVLSACDDIETFIFDEIDTGISGRTAQQVAVKMAELGKSRQILCITHLSQICAAGDNNYLIEKVVENGETHTLIKRLDEETIIDEIVRLNGGAEITEATVKAAKDMRIGNRR